MTDGQVLEFSHVTKRFGALTAVDDLSARIEPGAVTAFLGPNGAGKTTSLRMMLGQIRPSSGTATIGGVQHAELRHPLRTIGSVLEEAIYRPRRTAPRQLTIAAKANGIPLSRVDEVLALVGLQNDHDTRIGAYSLGMRQRLSIAGALLGDPGALVLDEPANGLDPEGIRWMRLLMRRLADEGRTILVSSHVLSEIEQVADNVLVLSKGRLVYADSIGKLSDPTTGSVIVDAEDRAALVTALQNAGLSYDVLRSGLTVHSTDAAAVGALAVSAGVALTTLQQRGPSLEEVFLDLVHGRRDPMTGAIPIAGAPVTEAPAEAPDGEGAEAPAEAGAEAPAEEGAELPPGDEADAAVPAAGLFGAAAAVPVVAAGAAGLFSGADAEGEATPIPTTRRAAAEYAAAQAADEPAEGSAVDPEATQALPIVEADGSAAAEGSAGPEEAEEGEGAEGSAEVEGADAEDAEVSDEAESTVAEDAEISDEAESTVAEDAEVSEEAESTEAQQDTASASEEQSAEDAAAEESGASDAEAVQDLEAGSEPYDEAAGSAENEIADDDTAGSATDDASEPAAEHDDEAPTIAAGVALTAPIDAPEYNPGEAPAADAEADPSPSEPREEGALTHAPEDGEEGAALGSFATEALTIPSEPRAVSFDELITGVPSGADAAQDEAASAEESGDDSEGGVAAETTVISTAPDSASGDRDDEFATPEPSTETTEIAGIEIFAALAEGRTQEIQVILEESHDEDDLAGEDVTQGEIHHDTDPRAAAVSASLAAAARAFYSDEAPSYTPAPAEDDNGGQEQGERAEQQQPHEHHGDDQREDDQRGDDQRGDEHDGH